eukprot:m.304867 g.304867  ORF g.304867 m.304867 type:complete len:62 (+) comp17333_c0_seq1:1399-1584(+)
MYSNSARNVRPDSDSFASAAAASRAASSAEAPNCAIRNVQEDAVQKCLYRCAAMFLEQSQR